MNNSDRNLNNDHLEDQLSRPNPLKNRIKQRAMAMDCDNTNEVHISSVLAAASALASLGNQPASSTPPSTPENPAAAGNMRLTLEQMMAAGNSRVLPRDFDQDVPMTFPQKLMEILSNSQLADIITWLPNGKGFIILQKRRFANEVMPLYFKHSKFTSFTRKLNRWGFTRVTRGPESGAYYHKYFQRGQFNLVMQMHCQSKISPKENAAVKENPAVSAIKSPGVSSAMSSLQLDESPSPAAGNATREFSTSNPNIFAPDLTRRDDSSTPKAVTEGSSVIKRPFGMNVQRRMHDEQQIRMLNSHQEMIRQQMANSQRVFSQNTFQLSLDPSFHQSASFGYDRTSVAKSRNPFVVQSAMNAARQSGPLLATTLHRQEHSSFRPQSNETIPMISSERQEHIKQPPMTDSAYLDMLRAKAQDEAASRFVSALGDALGTPKQTHAMINMAMQEQMRNFEERQRKAKEAEKVALTKVQSDASQSRPVENKPAGIKSNLAMTQRQVANLRDIAKNGQGSAKDRFPKTVRRASAA